MSIFQGSQPNKETKISRYIAQKDWDHVVKRAVKGDTVDDVVNDDGQLPLHCALEGGAPDNIIAALFVVDKSAVKHRDHLGRLPIHIALACKRNEEITMRMLTEYPDSSLIADNNNELPIHAAILSGCSPMLIKVLSSTQSCRYICNHNKGCLPFHLALQTGSHCDVVLSILKMYPEAAQLPDGRGIYPVNYLLPSCGSPCRHLQDLFSFSKADFYPFLEPWRYPATHPCGVRDVSWMINKGLLESRHVGQLVDMMLQPTDEGYLTNRLARIGSCVKEMIEKTENPVRSAIAAAACFASRARRAVTIREELEGFEAEFVSIACRFMQSSTIDTSLSAISDSATRLLVPQEPPHSGLLASLFNAGPVADAIKSNQVTFIAEPHVSRLIESVWYGGDWAYPIYNKMNDEVTRVGCVTAFEGYDDDDIECLVQEITKPGKAMSCPAIRFTFERCMDVVLGFAFCIAIWERNVEAYFSERELVLAVLMLAVALYEIGNMEDQGMRYFSDRWNVVNITLCSVYACYIFFKISAEHASGLSSYDSLVASQRMLSLCAIVLVFKVMQISILRKSTGVPILMIMEMIQDVFGYIVLFSVFLFVFALAMHSWLLEIPGFYSFNDTFFTLIAATFGSFDFSYIQQSGQWGEQGAAYWGGTILLTIYLIFVMIVLINLVIAKMSSTYQDVIAESFPKWCLMKALAVSSCQVPKSFLSVLPIPFNLLSSSSFCVSLIVLAILERFGVYPQLFDNSPDVVNKRSTAPLISGNHPVIDFFVEKFHTEHSSRTYLNAMEIASYVSYSVFFLFVSFPMGMVFNIWFGLVWGIAVASNSALTMEKRIKGFAWGWFVRAMLFTLIFPFYAIYLLALRKQKKEEEENVSNKRYNCSVHLSSLSNFTNDEHLLHNILLTAVNEAYFEIYRHRNKLDVLLLEVDQDGFINTKQFIDACASFRKRVIDFEDYDQGKSVPSNSKDKPGLGHLKEWDNDDNDDDGWLVVLDGYDSETEIVPPVSSVQSMSKDGASSPTAIPKGPPSFEFSPNRQFSWDFHPKRRESSVIRQSFQFRSTQKGLEIPLLQIQEEKSTGPWKEKPVLTNDGTPFYEIVKEYNNKLSNYEEASGLLNC